MVCAKDAYSLVRSSMMVQVPDTVSLKPQSSEEQWSGYRNLANPGEHFLAIKSLLFWQADVE